eukprot:10302149-Prorocentrum_lima.AAC.1
MTSSLVGSEMCIRDRLSRVNPPRPLPTGYPAGSTQSKPQHYLIPLVLLPVSYTHLTLPTICSV